MKIRSLNKLFNILTIRSILVTASSSDHLIKLWDLGRLETGEVECVGQVSSHWWITLAILSCDWSRWTPAAGSPP